MPKSVPTSITAQSGMNPVQKAVVNIRNNNNNGNNNNNINNNNIIINNPKPKAVLDDVGFRSVIWWSDSSVRYLELTIIKYK